MWLWLNPLDVGGEERWCASPWGILEPTFRPCSRGEFCGNGQGLDQSRRRSRWSCSRLSLTRGELSEDPPRVAGRRAQGSRQ